MPHSVPAPACYAHPDEQFSRQFGDRNKSKYEYTLQGWKAFALSHSVQTGDRLQIELVDEGRRMCANIVKRATLKDRVPSVPGPASPTVLDTAGAATRRDVSGMLPGTLLSHCPVLTNYKGPDANDLDALFQGNYLLPRQALGTLREVLVANASIRVLTKLFLSPGDHSISSSGDGDALAQAQEQQRPASGTSWTSQSEVSQQPQHQPQQQAQQQVVQQLPRQYSSRHPDHPRKANNGHHGKFHGGLTVSTGALTQQCPSPGEGSPKEDGAREGGRGISVPAQRSGHSVFNAFAAAAALMEQHSWHAATSDANGNTNATGSGNANRSGALRWHRGGRKQWSDEGDEDGCEDDNRADSDPDADNDGHLYPQQPSRKSKTKVRPCLPLGACYCPPISVPLQAEGVFHSCMPSDPSMQTLEAASCAHLRS
jgi:hypothetical protein